MSWTWPSGAPDALPGTIRDDPELRKALCLDWESTDSDDHVLYTPVVYLEKLPPGEWYPPKDHTVFEKGAPSNEENMEHLKHLKRKDNRHSDKRDKHIVLDDEKLQHVIRANESAIIRDKHTGDVLLVVMRNFVDSRLLAFFDEVVVANNGATRGGRRDDPGLMPQYGFCGGPRNKPKFQFARNIQKFPKTESRESFLKKHMHDIVSMQTIAWNIMLKKLPTEVSSVPRTQTSNIQRINWNQPGQSIREPVVSARIDSQVHEFTGLEMGPPSGVTSSRYSKYIHKETGVQDNPWVLSLTTARSVGPERAGSFLVAELGVQVEQSENTMIAHDSSLYHGTAVHDYDHAFFAKDENKGKEPDIIHRGFSIVPPSHLRTTFERTLLREPENEDDMIPSGSDTNAEPAKKRARADSGDLGIACSTHANKKSRNEG